MGLPSKWPIPPSPNTALLHFLCVSDGGPRLVPLIVIGKPTNDFEINGQVLCGKVWLAIRNVDKVKS